MTQLAPDSYREPAPHHPPAPSPQPRLRPRASAPEIHYSEVPARGRHATSLGQGFGWTVGWSILGALVPGSGLVAAGRRGSGYLVLSFFGTLLVGLVALALVSDPIALAAGFAVSQRRLLFLVAVITGLALVVAGVIVVSYRALTHLGRPTVEQRALGVALVVALAAVVLIPAAKVNQYALIQRDLVGSLFAGGAGSLNAQNPWAKLPRVNVLLLGSDAGADRAGVRTDTMILTSVNTRTGDTVMFSLPRNMEKVPFPEGTPGNRAFPDGYYCEGHQECLLNAIWRWAGSVDGEPYYPKSKYPNPGLAALKDAIEGVTGLRPNFYLMVNIEGFGDVVNALGGITVNVRQRLPIGGNSEHPEQTSGWIEPGENQHLDGYHALWFARSRWNSTDYDRMRRQRCTISAIMNRAQPANVVASFPKLAAAAKDNVSTDIRQGDLEAWAQLGNLVKKGDSVRSLPFTSTVVGNTADPDFEKIHRLVKQALNPEPAPQGSPTVAPTPTPSSSQQTTTEAERAKTDTESAQKVDDVC